MNTRQLPDDLNPAIIEATAIFIGKVTGLVPPPTDAFPREWYAPLRTFTKRLYQIAGENAPAAPRDDPTPLDDETVAVIRSFVDRPGETYRGIITRRLGIGFGRALRRAIEESRVDRASDAAGTPLTDVQRAAIQAAVDTASRVLRAGGDELSDAGLRRELKESRDMLRDMLDAAPPPTVAADAAAASAFLSLGEFDPDHPLLAKAAQPDERAAFTEFRAALSRLDGSSVSLADRVMILSNATFLMDEYVRAAAPQAALTDEQRDSIEYAQQVLRQVEASDGTFVGQCTDAISGLDALLATAPTIAADAAAPSDTRFTHPGCEVCACPPGVCQAEAAQPQDAFRQRVERLLVQLHNEDRLSEGQCAKVLDIHRIAWRKIADEAALDEPSIVGPDDLLERPHAERSRAEGGVADSSCQRNTPDTTGDTDELTREQDEDRLEARAILTNMLRSIEQHGPYSTETTCRFLRQAIQCLPVAPRNDRA
ncbi:hypothetical protein [Burkholderia multivorans]|uniref:hypothetical protein n=1 Tax=Burkholderia multivorans TaxID=87883 RepID=UPI001C239C81|nr:hypothetical protein [Burkholderia multivorans]MBU9212272.1 hypothetical protein [Burkholderia multivorans]